MTKSKISFRSAKSQAHHAITQKISLGASRHDNKADGKIHSVRSAINYEQSLTTFVQYIKDNRLGDLRSATREIAHQFLADRAAVVAQKTLDQDRQAIQMQLGVKLDVIKSERETILNSRAYTSAQVERIAGAQSHMHSLASRIAHNAGLRAHELLTLRPAGERSASGHREWSDKRFDGREGVKYTVEGKGGLIREVMISKNLSINLEKLRFPSPRMIFDRQIKYHTLYNIGGGRNWSQSVSAASKREFGWSNGAHGFRHSYAQERMVELQSRGYNYEVAKGIVAQEVGHFDSSTTEAYLR